MLWTIKDPFAANVIVVKIPSDLAYSIPSTIEDTCARASISFSLPKRISTFDFINFVYDSFEDNL